MDEVSRTHRETARATDELFLRAVGMVLLACTVLLIVAGPSVMSRPALTASLLLAVALGLSYGLYLASHSRSTHLSLERAYSAHLEELSQRLRNMAYRDAVTGLYNHRYFREQLAHEIERATRYGQALSLVLLDMNNFKEVNDRYGHFMGDRFLGLVGEIISRHVRASDIGARYGGDEFVVILPSTSRDEAESTAQKLATAVANSAAMTANGEMVELGISFGVASCPDEASSPNELIECADVRLYEAKSRRKTKGRKKHVA
jgi:diguanylate cyclase (GGDEF)-like protein